MAAEPTAEDVDGFCSITASTSQSDAVDWLKAYNNDLPRAINAFFEDPNALQTQMNHGAWEENQFHTDKNDTAFNVHGPDSLNPNVFADNTSAPSRPPTRNSHRNNEWSAEYGIGPNKQPTLAEQEQAEVERALAMSVTQDQETGVTDAAKPHFGAAKREYYDTKKWAMTVPAAHAQEILLNPLPVDRKRGANTPAFLKPSPAEHRLAALVKILHAVPLSREALLNRTNILSEYGHDSEWWDGVPIKLSRIVNISPSGQYDDRQEVVREAQRLMAFLDETDRAYGSVDVLANVDGIRKSRNSQIVGNFLAQWRTATWSLDPNATLMDIFRNEGTKVSQEVVEVPVFYALQISVDADIADAGLSLYEAFDDILWNGTGANDFEEVFLQKVADVFILELSRQSIEGVGLGIEIPAIWYPDRYLPSSQEQARAMQAGKAAARKEIQEIDLNIAKLSTYTAAGKPATNTSDLLKVATTYFEKSASSESASGDTSGASAIPPEKPGPDLERYNAIAQELKAVASRVEQKLKTLEDSKARAREKLLEFSKLYTSPSDDHEGPPYHKYRLCGVCAEPQIVYVLEQTKPNDENDMLSTEAEDWQWWKLSFDRRESVPVQRIKVQELEVLTAAKDQCQSAMLVYASEKAMSFTPEALPPQLQNFVRADNRSFAAELDTSTSPKPTSPAKRKADDEDEDDLSLKLYRSPTRGQNSEDSQATDNTDPTLPEYSSNPPRPRSPRPKSRIDRRKDRNAGTWDDLIPSTLQSTEPTLDHNMGFDNYEGGQEMQDRGHGMGLLQDGKDGMVKGGYSLGEYVPEISMDEGEDDEVEEIKHVGFPGKDKQ